MEKASPPQYYPSPINYQPAEIATTYPPAVVVPSPILPFGPNPQVAVCPYCHSNVTTRVKAEVTSKTHLIAAILCAVGCCCCLPYRMDSCKNRDHYCESCGAYLGTYANN